METGLSRRSSYAHVVRASKLAGLSLLECSYSPGLQMPRHSHNYAHFVLVLQGACTDTCRNRANVYGPSHLMFYPEGEEHASLFHGTGTHTFEIQLSLDQLENARQGSGALADPCDFDTGLPIWLKQKS